MKFTVRALALALAITFGLMSTARADILFSEDFESVTLEPAVNEAIPATTLGWTDTPPVGWTVDDSGVPGALSGDDARDGRTEWAGWSFASKTFWTTADTQQRETFALGEGVVAIADPDEWDDQAHDAGLFNAFMTSPTFSIANTAAGTLNLSFASSWRDECCDDGDLTNNQTALVYASYDGGADVEVLHWSSDANDGALFHNDNPNEAVSLALNPPAGTQTMSLKFGLTEAANDWWWAVDNVKVEGRVVPEPSTFVLGGVALIGLFGIARRRRA